MPDEIEDGVVIEEYHNDEQDDCDCDRDPEDTDPTVEEKIYNLTVTLHDLKTKKKLSNKIFNDEIKEINKEIEELLEAEEAPAKPETEENE